MDQVSKDARTFGLSETIRESLRDVFTRFPKIDRVIVYGSRATERHRPQSDIDLAVIAPAMSDREFSGLWMALDDLPILFRLDVSLWHQVTNAAMQQAMRDGVQLYPVDVGAVSSASCSPQENLMPASGFIAANQMNPEIVA